LGLLLDEYQIKKKKNELQCISVSVKELFGEGGGNEKKQFQRISSIKKPNNIPASYSRHSCATGPTINLN
jgi:hypothetical protein